MFVQALFFFLICKISLCSMDIKFLSVVFVTNTFFWLMAYIFIFGSALAQAVTLRTVFRLLIPSHLYFLFGVLQYTEVLNFNIVDICQRFSLWLMLFSILFFYLTIIKIVSYFFL